MIGSVRVKYTIGFGNNIFQYVFARILAETKGLFLIQDGIEPLNIPKSTAEKNNFNTIQVNDSNAMEILCNTNLSNNINYDVSGYFEDYRFYGPYIKDIQSWFKPIPKRKDNDLILHFRLQNRLIEVNHIKNRVNPKAYTDFLNTIEFDKLHIVTDAAKWEKHNLSDIELITKQFLAGPNANSKLVDPNISMNYMNELVSEINKFNPIIHCVGNGVNGGSGYHRSSFMDDFNLIRSFNNVMFQDSTFSWWAAFLGNATNAYPFKPWKPNKGNRNKNLGQSKYPGRKGWGNINDCTYLEKY